MYNKRLEIAANLLFWIISAWLILSGFSVQSREIQIINGVERIQVTRDTGAMWQLAACIGISACLFYANLLNIRTLMTGRRTRVAVIRSAAGLFLLAFLAYLGLARSGVFPPGPRLDWGLPFGVLSVYFTVSGTYGMSKVWLGTEAQKQQIALEKKQAELSLLRSQLHPHFLFNVLNNLLSMVDQRQNPLLADSIERLSGLLRYVVYESGGSAVSVRQEIRFADHYIDLQRLRFEAGEVDYIREIEGPYDEQLIEPGLFIPFVENAFKYGVEPERTSVIRLSFDLSDPGRLVFRISNPVYPAMRAQGGSGAGIPSVRRRLELIYPGRHRLDIEDGELFRVRLEIITADESHHRG